MPFALELIGKFNEKDEPEYEFNFHPIQSVCLLPEEFLGCSDANHSMQLAVSKATEE